MSQRELRIRDIMTRDVITAAPEGTILAAAQKMSDHGVSCVVIVAHDGKVAGILTERDVLRGVGACSFDFSRLRVSELMSSPVVLIRSDVRITEAGQIMAARRIKRLPVVDDGTLVGIITQTDITRGLIALSPIRHLEDIMTRDVATVDAHSTVEEAARIMSQRDISCLIAMHRGEPAGVFTEKDLLRRIIALHRDPAQTRVVEVMSFPIMTVPPSYSILSASKKMDAMHLHRLVVVEGKEVRGIVTQSDILRAIRDEFKIIEMQQKEMAARFADLLRTILPDTQNLQTFLDEIRMQRSIVSGTGAKPTEPAASATEYRTSGVL